MITAPLPTGARLEGVVGSEKDTSTAPAELAGADDLLAIARSTDAELTAPPPGSPAALELEAQRKRDAETQPALPLDQELAGMFAMIGTGAGIWLPRVGRVLCEPGQDGKSSADRLGEVLAPVAVKYRLDRYLTGGKWRLELQALMVAGPIALAIRDAARQDLAELARKQREAEGHPIAATPAGELSPSSSSASSPAIAAPPPAPIGMLQPIERPQPAA